MSHRTLWIWLVIGLLVSVGANGQEQKSFRSVNKGFFIRHQNQIGVITDITNEDGLGRSDATFWVVRGLTGQCNSLEAVKPTGFYLRHQNFRVVLAKFENSTQFRQDATFCMKTPGLTGGAGSISFEAVNFPNFYIRHFDFQLFVNKFEDNNTFKFDATFDMLQPLTQFPPHITL